MHKTAFISPLALITILVLGSGCTTPVSAPSQLQTAAVHEPSPFRNLRKGMTEEEIRAELGQPREIKPFTNSVGVESVVWTYRRPVSSSTTQEATSTREIPFIDPITGVEKMVPEPVFQSVVITTTETAQLLLIQGRLAEWSATRESSRSFQ